MSLGDERYLDAGLTAAIPIQAAIADGATHILVLRSRLEGETTHAPPGRGPADRAPAGARGPGRRARVHDRAEHELEVEAMLARHAADPTLTPHVLSIRPSAGSPVPSRLDRDVDRVAGHSRPAGWPRTRRWRLRVATPGSPRVAWVWPG